MIRSSLFKWGGRGMWAVIDQAAFALPNFLISLLLARWLTLEEDRAPIDQINQSDAGLVFLGLGCPKQEHFAYDHRDQIKGVQLCVGAAFDFHAGCKTMAPKWMQRNGLEWAFRLITEPRRLWKRYLRTNSLFMLKVIGHELGM